MFTTLKNAFRIKDIRHKIGFTFLMLIIIRLGSTIPVPGINVTVFQNWFKELSSNNALGFMDRFTGGSFEKMSILALNITPYITSSIIIQLLTIAIPKFEEWQRDGEEGRKKLTNLTRYITIALALIESVAMAIGFYRQGFLTNQSWVYCIEIVAALTAGSASRHFSNSIESCRFAPLTKTTRGTPRASTTICRLEPSLPLSVGLGPVSGPPGGLKPMSHQCSPGPNRSDRIRADAAASPDAIAATHQLLATHANVSSTSCRCRSPSTEAGPPKGCLISEQK